MKDSLGLELEHRCGETPWSKVLIVWTTHLQLYPAYCLELYKSLHWKGIDRNRKKVS